MKYHRLFSWLVVGMLCLGLVSCANMSKKVVVDDQTIADSIKNYLESPSGPVGPFTIDILVNNGVVTLDGTVPTTAAKAQAMEIANSAEGVAEVKSFLVVR